jgi:hypothetical protein
MSNTIAHFCNPKELPPIITIILVLGDRNTQENARNVPVIRQSSFAAAAYY